MGRRRKSIKNKITAIIFVVFIIGIGLCLAFCYITATSGAWIEFGICLSVAVVSTVTAIPLYYLGDKYVCPKCGQVFRVNPYKVFFTNGILGIFDFGSSYSKRYNLTCPCCKEKVYCRRSK